jgi:hypothetical protein
MQCNAMLERIKRMKRRFQVSATSRYVYKNHATEPVARLYTLLNGAEIAVHFDKSGLCGRYVNEKPHNYGSDKTVDKLIDGLFCLRNQYPTELADWLSALSRMTSGKDNSVYKVILRAESSLSTVIEI